MPDQKLFQLCHEISTQKDSQQLAVLVEEVIQLLNEEQDTIKAKIRANIDRIGIPRQ